MHCAGGCAKMIENSLNQNDGILAAVDFQNSSAAIIYDSEKFSDSEIVTMINGYRDGKFTALAPSVSNNSTKNAACAKGKNCCQKSGKKMRHAILIKVLLQITSLKERINKKIH